jgi:hypothetical protein
MRKDIDEALNGWPYDPEPGTVTAREVRSRDGRKVVQVRQELGILQMEIESRPDGMRPHGFATYLEYLRHRAAARGNWTMGREHFRELDREVVQFYHRRMAWLALHRYDRMRADAEHTLALMDFIRGHCDDEEYVASHERFRGLVLFHRAQARAALALERRRPDEAVEVVREAAESIERHRESWRAATIDDEADDTPDAALLEQLRQIEQEIRRSFDVRKTLREELDEAIAREDYERAAILRDKLRSRGRR